jgi:non-ribosomal peptide synthetase-like protein
VAARWSRPGRTIYNSYGPSEITVVATVAEVRPDAPVTIGRPIPNYSCYVVDESLRLLPPGVEGELLIGGPGVARGYLNREALTREKFIANPFSSDGDDPVLYRSGDAALIDDRGDLVFRGRVDDQIKIRGFRVELGEIESVLCEQHSISQAAVALRDDSGVDALVAFLVLDGEAPDRREIRGALSERLPPYMIPARFEIVDALPRLHSGKVDRSALARVPLRQEAADVEDQEEPRDEIEAALLAAAKKTLPPGAIAFDADFFTDLGGHSLLAARFVSAVRETPRLASITLQDLYALRTLRALARHLEGKTAPEGETRDLSFAPPLLLRRFLCGLAQAVALPFILAIVTAQWLGVFVSYRLIASSEASLAEEAAALLGVYACVNLATLIVSIAGKWIVIGRTMPGRYPLWGVYYYRWWLAQRLTDLTASKWFQLSPLMRLYLTALGARVGKDALISDLHMGAVDLVSIGRGASLGAKLKLANARVEGDELVIGRIEIGADAHVGASCVIEEDVRIEAGAALEDLSSVPAGTRIGAGEVWNGSPARQIGAVDTDALDAPATTSPARRGVFTALFAILSLAIPPLGLLPVVPAFWAFDKLEGAMQLSESQQHLHLALVPLFAWPAAFVLVLATLAFMVAFRWAALPRLEEGRYSVWSWFFLRKWAVTLADEVALETLSSLFATLYMRSWYRLMGAKIGKDSEISASLAGRYDLVEIGEKCFVADEATLGDEDIRRGWIYLRRIKTGDRVFIGNDSVVPPGAEIPDDALIGVKSRPPGNSDMSPGDAWFGSPPIRLPRRETFDAGGSNWTYAPPAWRKALRAAYEAVGISLPTTLFITFGTWAVESFGQNFVDGDHLGFVRLFVLDSALMSIAMTLAVVAVKWLTMGRYEPQVKPLWSFWAMRTESCAVLYWGMAGRVLLDHLRGTPFLPWALRLFGAKVGKGVFLDMVDITEFDCVKIGDYCAVNMQSALQAHLYEDRVMKVGRVELGKGVTVGAGSTVLYDTHVGDFARLGPLTVVMKGEKIPPHSQWIGAPAEPPARTARL